jgi:hypothetical protein
MNAVARQATLLRRVTLPATGLCDSAADGNQIALLSSVISGNKGFVS